MTNNKKLKREFVTPYLVFIFGVVSLSGILMFFHLLDDYTKVVHEFLGLSFAIFAILHLVLNWKSVKNYADKRQLILPSIITLVVAIGLITVGKLKGNLEDEILTKFVKAPISYSFKIMDVNYDNAKATFDKNGIVVKDSLETIEEISERNQKSPEEIVELIMKNGSH